MSWASSGGRSPGRYSSSSGNSPGAKSRECFTIPSRTSNVRLRPGKAGVGIFEGFDDAQGLAVVFETLAKAPHQTIQLLFAGMRKRGMADIVGQSQGLGKALIQPQRGGDGAGDLRNLDGMGQAVAEMVGEAGGEHLRLVLQPAECAGVHDAVAVALEFVAIGMGGLGITPAPRPLHRKPQVREGRQRA